MHARNCSVVVAVAVTVMTMSCTGFKAIERGDFKHVFADARGTMKAIDKQDIITTEAWEAEVASSVQRAYVPAPGLEITVLQETPESTIDVFEIREFRVDESEPVELFVDGPLETWWNPVKKIDGWKDHNDVVVKLSLLFVRGKKAGKATLRVTTEKGTTDSIVNVK